jgi:hypothetical protein
MDGNTTLTRAVSSRHLWTNSPAATVSWKPWAMSVARSRLLASPEPPAWFPTLPLAPALTLLELPPPPSPSCSSREGLISTRSMRSTWPGAQSTAFATCPWYTPTRLTAVATAVPTRACPGLFSAGDAIGGSRCPLQRVWERYPCGKHKRFGRHDHLLRVQDHQCVPLPGWPPANKALALTGPYFPPPPPPPLFPRGWRRPSCVCEHDTRAAASGADLRLAVHGLQNLHVLWRPKQ